MCYVEGENSFGGELSAGGVGTRTSKLANVNGVGVGRGGGLPRGAKGVPLAEDPEWGSLCECAYL